MLRKSITYTNPFTEKEVTEEHYFHISKADLVEMEMEEHNTAYEKDGKTLTGMRAKLQRIVDSEDGKAIMVEFKDMLRRSYGKKEGDRFLKSQAIWEDFAATEAFSQLLFELCTQADAAAEFVNAVVPSNLEQIAAEVQAQAEKEEQAEPSREDPTGLTDPSPDTETPRTREIANATAENPVILNRVELVTMDDNTLKAGLADGRYKLS